MAVLMTCSMCVTSTLAEDNKRKEAQEDRVTILFTHDMHSRLDEFKSDSGNGWRHWAFEDGNR